MNKLKGLIEGLSEEDLMKIKRDLIAGNIDRLVNNKIDELTLGKISEKQCPVCGGGITKDSYSLEFGSAYLRRRAYFDAVDCLEYFIYSKLKKQTVVQGT